MTAPFKSVAELIHYIQSHKAKYDFAPESITVSPDVYKALVSSINNITLYKLQGRLYKKLMFMGTHIEQEQA